MRATSCPSRLSTTWPVPVSTRLGTTPATLTASSPLWASATLNTAGSPPGGVSSLVPRRTDCRIVPNDEPLESYWTVKGGRTRGSKNFDAASTVTNRCAGWRLKTRISVSADTTTRRSPSASTKPDGKAMPGWVSETNTSSQEGAVMTATCPRPVPSSRNLPSDENVHARPGAVASTWRRDVVRAQRSRGRGDTDVVESRAVHGRDGKGLRVRTERRDPRLIRREHGEPPWHARRADVVKHRFVRV